MSLKSFCASISVHLCPFLARRNYPEKAISQDPPPAFAREHCRRRLPMFRRWSCPRIYQGTLPLCFDKTSIIQLPSGSFAALRALSSSAMAAASRFRVSSRNSCSRSGARPARDFLCAEPERFRPTMAASSPAPSSRRERRILYKNAGARGHQVFNPRAALGVNLRVLCAFFAARDADSHEDIAAHRRRPVAI